MEFFLNVRFMKVQYITYMEEGATLFCSLLFSTAVVSTHLEVVFILGYLILEPECFGGSSSQKQNRPNKFCLDWSYT